MLLRRLTQHIKDQNWFAVGIDFAIVVFGVVIGIQVANWNDQRVAAANEAALMVRLAEEMRALEAELAVDVEGYKHTVDSTGALIDVLRADAMPADDQQFRNLLWQANHFYEVPSLSASYTELVASGGLSRIADEELRAALIRYGDYYERYNRLYAVSIGTILDSESNYLKAVEWSTDPGLWTDAQAAIVSYDWIAIQSAEAELQSWLAFQNDGERNIRNMYLEVQKIRSLLKK